MTGSSCHHRSVGCPPTQTRGQALSQHAHCLGLGGGGECWSGWVCLGSGPKGRTAVSSSRPWPHSREGHAGDTGLAAERLGIPFLCPQERSAPAHAHEANVQARLPASLPGVRVRGPDGGAAPCPRPAAVRAARWEGCWQQSPAWGPRQAGVLHPRGGHPQEGPRRPSHTSPGGFRGSRGWECREAGREARLYPFRRPCPLPPPPSQHLVLPMSREASGVGSTPV